MEKAGRCASPHSLRPPLAAPREARGCFLQPFQPTSGLDGGAAMGLRNAAPGNGLRRELHQSPPACMRHLAKKPAGAGADGRRMPPLCTAAGAAATMRLAHQQPCWPTRPPVHTGASVSRGALQFASDIRQGPSGPAFRTRAGGALGTTGHTRSQYQNQVHQEDQQNENQG